MAAAAAGTCQNRTVPLIGDSEMWLLFHLRKIKILQLRCGVGYGEQNRRRMEEKYSIKSLTLSSDGVD